MFAPAHLPLRVLSYQLIRTSFKYYSKVFPTGGLKTLYIARCYRNSLPSPSSTDISIVERRFGFGMVVEFTLVGFDWESWWCYSIDNHIIYLTFHPLMNLH